jgi:hypothetical protein
MTRILTIIALLIATPILASCAPPELEVASYAKIDNPTKRILAPAGLGQEITKFLKGWFRKNGWTVVVETRTREQTLSDGVDKSITETLYDAPYRMFVNERTRIEPCYSGDDYVWFALSIVAAESGEEIFVADGDGCVGPLQKELSPKLDAVFTRGEMIQNEGEEGVVIPIRPELRESVTKRRYGLGG